MLHSNELNGVKIRNKSGHSLWTLLFNFILQVFTNAIRQKKKKKRNKRPSVYKGRIWSVFKDDLIVHLENSKESAKKPLRTNELSKQKMCQCTSNEHLKNAFKQDTPFAITTKGNKRRLIQGDHPRGWQFLLLCSAIWGWLNYTFVP